MGLSPAQEPRRPFRDFIAWLENQDLAGAEAYLRSRLHGFTAPTPLGLAGRSPGHDISPADAREDWEIQLSESLPSRSTGWSSSGFTLGTLMQGIWALLLSRYSRQDDVCFGLACRGQTGGATRL